MVGFWLRTTGTEFTFESKTGCEDASVNKASLAFIDLLENVDQLDTSNFVQWEEEEQLWLKLEEQGH